MRFRSYLCDINISSEDGLLLERSNSAALESGIGQVSFAPVVAQNTAGHEVLAFNILMLFAFISGSFSTCSLYNFNAEQGSNASQDFSSFIPKPIHCFSLLVMPNLTAAIACKSGIFQNPENKGSSAEDGCGQKARESQQFW